MILAKETTSRGGEGRLTRLKLKLKEESEAKKAAEKNRCVGAVTGGRGLGSFGLDDSSDFSLVSSVSLCKKIMLCVQLKYALI